MDPKKSDYDPYEAGNLTLLFKYGTWPRPHPAAIMKKLG